MPIIWLEQAAGWKDFHDEICTVRRALRIPYGELSQIERLAKQNCSKMIFSKPPMYLNAHWLVGPANILALEIDEVVLANAEPVKTCEWNKLNDGSSQEDDIFENLKRESDELDWIELIWMVLLYNYEAWSVATRTDYESPVYF